MPSPGTPGQPSQPQLNETEQLWADDLASREPQEEAGAGVSQAWADDIAARTRTGQLDSTEVKASPHALWQADIYNRTQKPRQASDGEAYGGAIGRGIRSALLPFDQTKAEMEADQGLKKAATKALTNLAVGMGVTALGTAALGAAAVPVAAAGTIAAGLYGLYAGLGYEYARSKAEDKDFSTGRAAVAAALEINPLIKQVSKVWRLARVGAQVVGSTGLEYAHSKDAAQAGLAGTISLFLSPVMYFGMRKSRVTPKTGSLIEEAAAPHGADILRKSMDRFSKEQTPAWVTWRKITPEIPEVSGTAIPGKPVGPIADVGLDGTVAVKTQVAKPPKGVTAGNLDKTVVVEPPSNLPTPYRFFDPEQGAVKPKVTAKVEPKPKGPFDPGTMTKSVAPPEPTSYNKLTPAQLGKVVPREFVEFVVDSDSVKGRGAAKRAAVYGKFKDIWDKLGFVKRQELYAIWRLGKIQTEEAIEVMARSPLGKLEHRDLQAFRRWTAPAVYVARKLDSVLDTDFEGGVANLLRAKDRYTVVAAAYFKKLEDIERRVHKSGITHITVNGESIPVSHALYRAVLDETDSSDLARAVQTQLPELVADTRKLTASLHQELVNQGFNPGDLGKVYMPQLAKQGAEAAGAVRARLAELLDEYGSVRNILAHSDQKDVQEVVEYAKQIYQKSDINAGDLSSLPEAIMTRFKDTQGVTPGAVLTRRGDMPAFIQETDAFKLLQRYIHGNLKAAVLDTPLKELRAGVGVLQGAGLKRGAEWLDSLVDRASGVPGGVSKHWRAGMERIRDVGLEIQRQNPDSTWGKFLDQLPETLGRLNALVYPARMISPRAWTRNLTQSFATTAPELGGTYGYGVVRKGLRRAYESHGMNFAKMKEVLQQAEQLGDITSEQGVRRQSMGVIGATADWVNEKGMAPFVATDLINRSVALHAGHQWADDLRAGVPAALKALRGASAGLRARVAGMDPADPELGNYLGSYLITKTQFRYGPETQSELVRFLGPAFGQFTMWPQMAFWDLVESAQHASKWGKLAARFTPLLALYAARGLVDKADSTAAEYFIGDPTDLSPYPGVLSTGVLVGTGPVVEAVAKAPGAVARVFRSDEPGKEAGRVGRDVARGVLTDWVPPVSAVVNEVDRWTAASDRAKGKRKTRSRSREFVNEYLGGPK